LIHQPSLGCARPTRKFIKQHARSIITSVIALVESFVTLKALDGNEGAQKTGSVWSACDAISTKLPKGNRACMRREMFTWAGDCNETMEEFQEIVDLGPVESASDGQIDEGNNSDDPNSWDKFCENMGTGERYTNAEIDVANACLAIIKCSRGVLNLALKASECAGNEIKTCKETTDALDSKGILQWISNLHELSRKVGENVTDLGMVLYPPINLAVTNESNNTTDGKTWMKTDIWSLISMQIDATKAVANYVVDVVQPVESHTSIKMSEEVKELGSKLLFAIDNRKVEAENALSQAFSHSS